MKFLSSSVEKNSLEMVILETEKVEKLSDKSFTFRIKAVKNFSIGRVICDSTYTYHREEGTLDIVSQSNWGVLTFDHRVFRQSEGGVEVEVFGESHLPNSLQLFSLRAKAILSKNTKVILRLVLE